MLNLEDLEDHSNQHLLHFLAIYGDVYEMKMIHFFLCDDDAIFHVLSRVS